MSTPVLAALAKHDASRLPCGALEKWVFSTDRRKLLSPKVIGLDEKEEDTKGNDDDNNVSTPRKTLFVSGSEDEFYYTMLQIDNEIQKESLKKDCNQDIITKLQNEFNDYINKVKEKWDERKRYVTIPTRINNLIFRNCCRQITDNSNLHKQLDAITEIEKRITPQYDYSKPKDVNKGIYSSTSKHRKFKEYISEKELQTKLDNQMTNGLNKQQSQSNNISSHYKTCALSYLMNQESKLRFEQKQNIINGFNNKLLIVGNENKILEWIMDDLNDSKYKYTRFGFRNLHSQLTLMQLDELKNRKQELLSVSSFIELYLKRLMPLELGIYIGKDWEKDIPLEMKWKFMRKLYNYANGNDLMQADYNSSNSIQSYIYYQYMIFMEQNYYLLNKKGDMIENDDDKDGETKNDDDDDDDDIVNEGLFDNAYDLEAIIRYILIPKSISYNAAFRDKYYKEHGDMAWGGDTRMTYNTQYSFLSQFGNVPRFSQSGDNLFFERFFEFIFTENGKIYWKNFIENKDNISDENVKKFLEFATVDENTIIRVFSEYIDGDFIEKMRLRSIIKNAMYLDELDENIKKLKELYGEYYIKNLKDETLIEFDKFKNPKYFNINEQVEIFVNVKNINDLTIKIFEMNTKSYYRDKEKQIETDMNLDGLNASIEYIKTNKEIGIKNNYHFKEITIDFPKELNGKRGVYFIDILSNGIHSRCVIKIGDIRYITRITEAGHLFQLLDEENKLIKNGSIFMSGHLKKTDEKGDIFIPFTTRSNASQNIILERDDNPTFNVLTTFNHQIETYSMQCGIYVDREQLLEKKRANIMVRVGLFCNGNRVTNKLLENIKLCVKLQTGDGVDVDKMFNNFIINDDKESIATFTVPNEPRSIHIRLDAQVKNMSQNVKQSLSKSVNFNINSIDNSSNIGQMFLIPNINNSYIVALYGKNGEGIANKDIEITLDSKYYKSAIIFSLTSDNNGRIYLPENINKNYIRLRTYCKDINGIRCDWDLNNGINYCDTPNIINMTTNASIYIPYVSKLKSNELSFGLFDKYYIKSYNENSLQYDTENGYIIIKNLPSGHFILKCIDLDYDINIYVTEYGQLIDSGRYNVNKNEIVELSPIKPLQISDIVENINDEKEHILSIKLNGINDRTRIHILSTHMISRFSILKYLNCIDPLSLSKKFISPCINFYLKQRTIGEELRYILEREKSKKYIGNSLIRPSFLIKPLQHKETNNKTQIAKTGQQLEREIQQSRMKEERAARRKTAARLTSTQSPNNDKYNIEFIGVTADLISNQKPDNNTGILNINLSQLNINQKFIRIIAFDEENCCIRGISLNNISNELLIEKYKDDEKEKELLYKYCKYEYTDNRLNPGLEPKYQYVDERNIVLLNEKDVDYQIDDFKTSQIETYQSFSDIFNLIQTISNNNELKIKWSFLTQWKCLSQDEKLKKYDEFFCHELHLFLKKRDIKFFNDICVPLISSKLNKDFMDYYLLNDINELIFYCQFENLQSLNPLEQILLIKLFKKDKPKLCKSFFEFYKSKQESLDINVKTFDKLFRTALATKAMDDTQTIQQNIEKKQAQKLYKNLLQFEAKEEAEDEKKSDDDTWGYTFKASKSTSRSIGRNMNSARSMQVQHKKKKKRKKKSGGGSRLMKKSMALHSYESVERSIIEPQSMRFGSHQEERIRVQQQQLFKQVEQTKEYQETYYYKILFEQNTKHLIPLNKFWCSYGIHMLNMNECDKPFLSEYFLFATSSINEILCVLSVMDIDFNQDNIIPDFKYCENGVNDQSVRIIANTPTILFAKELKKQICDSDNDILEEKKEEKNQESESGTEIEDILNEIEEKEEINQTIKQEWIVGTKCEVFSKSMRKWIAGEIRKIFTDNEGEWLEVKYGKNNIKEIQRYSNDIRPIKIDDKKYDKQSIESSDNESVSGGVLSTISIHVVYFDPTDKYSTDENGERMDKFVNKYDMRCGKIYGCLSILTNVSSIRQRIEILCQIPVGSIPVNGGFRTKTNFITLNAYSVHKFEFYFYFPENGIFRQYPIVVTKKNKIIGSSKKSKTDECKIIIKPQDKDKKVDIKSWNDVSLNGSNNDVLSYIELNNLNKLDITRIYYKLNKDMEFYDKLIELLFKQGYYNSNIWSMQLYYYKQSIKNAIKNINKTEEIDENNNDINKRFIIVKQYLSMNSTFKNYIQPYFNSNKFEYDDLKNNKYNYLEYIPLVNARAHLLGQKREILNDSFKSQYRKCLFRCSYRSTNIFDLKYDDIISLLYYLLLQDRVEESLDLYKIIQNNQTLKQQIEQKIPICFDYFKAYMALFVNEEIDEKNKETTTNTFDNVIDNAINVAQNIASKYRNQLLISSKRKLFEDIEVLLTDLNDYKREDENDKDKIIHSIGDRDRTMNKLADDTPCLDFEIIESERQLNITCANITQLKINFYTMNTEILFSNSPFFKNENNSNDNNKSAFAYIAPNISHEIEIKENDNNKAIIFNIPNELKNKNLFIEIISSTLNISKTFYDQELTVLIKESYGQLKVLIPSNKNKNQLIPLKKAYVKVYSQTHSGENEFYKDGYTDIRGKFDYASISTDQLNKTKTFAIFVKAPNYGSIVKECKPPKR